jgi:CDP-diacylglycerol--serine O-phosphatidyltransferase
MSGDKPEQIDETNAANANKSSVSNSDGIQESLNQLDDFLPVDDVVQEVSVDGKKVQRKGVLLLPNLFTTGALFSGFYSIISAMQGRFEVATIAILAAMILDILDGRVARLANAQSDFGAEYDSLSDMVSFGVAPAIVSFSWALSSLGKVGWAATFIYVVGAAVRLARFNTMAETADKRYFTGLASPAAAATLACTVWLCTDLGLVGDELPRFLAILVAVLTAGAGLLMVSNFQYQSFKGFSVKDRVPMAVFVVAVVVFALVVIDPPTVLLFLLLSYVLSGPLFSWKLKRGK